MNTPPARAAWLPGFLLAALIAGLGFALAEIETLKQRLHLSPLLLVILIGMLIATLRRPGPLFEPGIRLAQRPLLRWGVAGLGLKLSLPELLAFGWEVLAIVVVTTLVALLFGVWIARRLGLDERFALLLSTGGAICGASAVVAADSVVQAQKSHSIYSLGIITLLGTIGILIYPPLGRALLLSDFDYGVWDGATLHEMAQVVAAGAAYSDEAQKISTAVKLARICLLAPVVLLLGLYVRRRFGHAGTAKVALMPWFLVLFVLLALANSLKPIAPAWDAWLAGWRGPLLRLDQWLLCIGMAGVGLHSGLSELRAAGLRPLLAGTLQWLLLAGLALAMIWAI